MSTAVVIVFLVLCIVSLMVISTPVGSRSTTAQDLIESIPKKDRGLFVSFHLLKALNGHRGMETYAIRLPKQTNIPKDKYEKFKDTPTYSQFSSHLLQWTKATFNMTNADVYALGTQVEYYLTCLRSHTPRCFGGDMGVPPGSNTYEIQSNVPWMPERRVHPSSQGANWATGGGDSKELWQDMKYLLGLILHGNDVVLQPKEFVAWRSFQL